MPCARVQGVAVEPHHVPPWRHRMPCARVQGVAVEPQHVLLLPACGRSLEVPSGRILKLVGSSHFLACAGYRVVLRRDGVI